MVKKLAILPTLLVKKKFLFFYQWDLAAWRTKLHEGITVCVYLKKERKTRERLVREIFF